jgi:lipopolysaccharide transport system permease protein
LAKATLGKVDGTDATAIERPHRAGAERGELPIIEITGGRGRISRDSLREIWHFREVLAAFVSRQVKVRYKQAVIGVGWAIMQPVLAAGLFAIFLGRLSHVPSEGAPYLLFALAGMVVWTFFSGAVSTGSDSLVSQQALLRKLYFPRELLPLSALGVAFLDLVTGLAVLIVAGAAYGRYPHLSWIAFALPFVPLTLAAAAAALALSGINVYYRDVRYALPFVLQIGLFATPVVYSLSVVPGSWRTVYAVLNPVASAIDGVRRIFVHGHWPDFALLAGATGWSLVLVLLAYALFKRLERGFADRV